MRLIDADALLERVWSEKIQAQAHGREFSTCFMSPGGTPSTEWWYVEDLIENAPTIEPERRWIPVSEKAHPDLPIRVQVQMNNGWIITAYYQDGEWLSVPDCEDAIHDEWIEAWRELPEPFQEEGGE